MVALSPEFETAVKQSKKLTAKPTNEDLLVSTAVTSHDSQT